MRGVTGRRKKLCCKPLLYGIVQHCNSALLCLGPHCAYFRMRKLKPQVAKVSTVASVRSENY